MYILPQQMVQNLSNESERITGTIWISVRITRPMWISVVNCGPVCSFNKAHTIIQVLMISLKQKTTCLLPATIVLTGFCPVTRQCILKIIISMVKCSYYTLRYVWAVRQEVMRWYGGLTEQLKEIEAGHTNQAAHGVSEPCHQAEWDL